MTTKTKSSGPARPLAARAATKIDAPKSARLEGRIAADIKALIAQAAALSGNNFTEFVISAARDRAMSVIRDHQVLTLSARDAQAFQNALDNPPPAGARLKKAFKRYKALQKPV